ncbi:MAG: hypothetical protein M0R39_13280 [Prolixibacteraceae bacterium]|nr:hypothetical protein [Prolixibacteraceae bacterium]
MFQFHDGSIGSKLTSVIQISPPIVSIPRWFDWEEENKRLKADIEICFNSTMVRLGGRFSVIMFTGVCMFQFHDGSIGSLQGAYLQGAYLVSIPRWFDWETKNS